MIRILDIIFGLQNKIQKVLDFYVVIKYIKLALGLPLSALTVRKARSGVHFRAFCFGSPKNKKAAWLAKIFFLWRGKYQTALQHFQLICLEKNLSYSNIRPIIKKINSKVMAKI